MKIAIDVSQLAYPGTGVANYLGSLVQKLLEIDRDNQYILFFSSARGEDPRSKIQIPNKSQKVKFKIFKFPPSLLHILWNKLHIAPIEWFVGDVDVFISSDWTEPPTKRAQKMSILYDLIAYKYPEETHSRTGFNWKIFAPSANIVSIQKKKHFWMVRECSKIFCISESTRRDAAEILGIDKNKLEVIYPGV